MSFKLAKDKHNLEHSRYYCASIVSQSLFCGKPTMNVRKRRKLLVFERRTTSTVAHKIIIEYSNNYCS